MTSGAFGTAFCQFEDEVIVLCEFDISHYEIVYKFQEVNTETGEGKEMLFEPLPCVQASMCVFLSPHLLRDPIKGFI